MTAKDANPDLSALEDEAKEFVEDLARALRKARKLERQICDAAEAGNDTADAARFDVNMMVVSLGQAVAYAGAAHRKIPDFTVQFGGGKG